jgi:hypothetical protein
VVTHGDLRIEPSAETLSAARAWLDPVRAALGHEFLAGYLTGSVLTQGFDPGRSRINVLVVARSLAGETLEAVRGAVPATRRPPHMDPLFLTRLQIEKSLDVFPIEWLEIQERSLLLAGEDVFHDLQVPRTFLRLQCEHELRGKHIQLRQAYLLSGRSGTELGGVLRATASSFATLFRTLLRLRGETPAADTAHVIERVSDLFGLDAEGLLVAHLVRHPARRYKTGEILSIYRKFLGEIDRLVTAIDQLRVT